jgi:NADPH2:quinone reductase
MQRIVYDVTGDPEVLRLVEDPVPEPGPGEVRVKIYRSAVNPTDWKSRRGSKAGELVEPAQTPNQDGAGVVDAVGAGVQQSLVGLRVWVWEAAHANPFGTAAEYSVVPERHVVTLPSAASFDLGAALGVPFVTAHRCLTVGEDGPLRLGPGALAGRTVLIAGGAGAVGNAAIQLARWSDATVIATVSSAAKAQLAAAAGADHVVDYRRQDVVSEMKKIKPSGVDTIVEVAAAGNAATDAAVLGSNGCVACYADNGGGEAVIPIRASMTSNARWQFVLLYNVAAAAKERAFDDVSAALVDGAIGVGDDRGVPLHHYPLDRTVQAHRSVEEGAVGKVLVDVCD